MEVSGWQQHGQEKDRMVMVWMAALWLLRAQPGISTQDLKPASRIYCREKGLPGGWAGNYPALDGRIIDSTNLPFCPPRELGATFLEQDCWEPWKKTGVTHGPLNITDAALEVPVFEGGPSILALQGPSTSSSEPCTELIPCTEPSDVLRTT